MKNPACIIAVSGYSGSGKTTLIERALSELKREGIAVGILKHTSHHLLDLDREDKDTDRFYRAGADYVHAHDADQGFARYPLKSSSLSEALDHFPRGLDLILVEGHKNAELPRIWIEPDRSCKAEIPQSSEKAVVLCRNDSHYLGKCLAFIHAGLEQSFAARSLKAGILVGGKSSRMGRPKSLLEIKGKTLAEKMYQTLSAAGVQAALLGACELPASLRGTADRLPDVPGIQGPLAGMLSAFRWDPDSAWIITAVDMPFMDPSALDWLLSKRRPGIWAVLPRITEEGPAETTGACYEPMIFPYIESLGRKGTAKLQSAAKHPKVLTPLIPKRLVRAWQNVNTPKDWEAVMKMK